MKREGEMYNNAEDDRDDGGKSRISKTILGSGVD
jgi:hypothetical protein